jgi:hypothetical protein
LGISEDKAYRTLKPKLVKLWNSVYDANERYRTQYPDLTLHRRTTRAAIQNDLICARIIEEFDEVPDCRMVTDRKRNLRYFMIEDWLLLWFKKVSFHRIPSNYLTEHAKDILMGQQIEMFPKAGIVVVGYLLDAEENHIKRLSFAPPSLRKPEWYFDVARMAKLHKMNGPQRITQGTQLTVTRGAKQIIL